MPDIEGGDRRHIGEGKIERARSEIGGREVVYLGGRRPKLAELADAHSCFLEFWRARRASEIVGSGAIACASAPPPRATRESHDALSMARAS